MTPDRTPLQPIPSLDELAAHPERARELPVEALTRVFYQALTVLSALSIGISKPTFFARVVRVDDEVLIGPDEVATLIGMSKSWVEKHVRDLPERVSVLGNPRWRKRDIERWIKTRPAYGSPS